MRFGKLIMIEFDIVINPILESRKSTDLRSSIRFHLSFIVSLIWGIAVNKQLFDGIAVEVAALND